MPSRTWLHPDDCHRQGLQHPLVDVHLDDEGFDLDLRAPNVEERTSKVRVEVRRLDDVLEALGVARVDFVKLDVEGAELSFLRGARRLLGGEMRPAILGGGAGCSNRALGICRAGDCEVSSGCGVRVVRACR